MPNRKSALITGGAGFLGRHFARELEYRGWDVVTLDLEHADVPLKITAPTTRVHLIQDARTFFDSGRRLTADHAFDLVIHCAAKNPHRAAIDSEPLNLAYNVELDAALFNWANWTRPGRVVYVSSSAVYPVRLQTSRETALRLRENFAGPQVDVVYPHEPDGPYGWTKHIGERMAEAYRAVGGRVTIVRPFSGYGSDQSTNFPFNALINRVIAGDDPVEIWGDPQQERDWVHVSDIVKGVLTLVEREVNGPVNVCTGRGTSMYELVKMTGAFLERSSVNTLGNPDRPMGVGFRVGHPSRFFNYYQPQMTLELGIIAAVEHRRREVTA